MELEKSLFRKIGDPVLSGVSKVANLFDVPASILRDTAGLVGTGNIEKYNPIDQIFSPFSHNNRVFSRDLLSDLGVMAPNKKTGMKGWLDDPMEAVRDLSAFGVDIVSDPFLFAPKQTLKAIGAVGRGLDKATDFVPFAKGAKSKAAALGKNAKLLGNRLFDADVRGVHSMDPKIQGKARELSAAERANKAKILSEQIPYLNAMKKEGLLTPQHQEMISDLLEDAKITRTDPVSGQPIFKERTPQLAEDGTPLLAPDGTPLLNPLEPELFSKVEPGDVPETIQKYVDFLKGRHPETLETAQASGGLVKALEDIIGYRHRQASDPLLDAMAKNQPLKEARAKMGGDQRPMGTTDPRDAARSGQYKGFAGGSNEVNEFLSDPRWRAILDNANTDREALSMIEDLIGIDKYNDPNAVLKFFEKYKIPKGGGDPRSDAIGEAARGLADRWYGATIQKEFQGKVTEKVKNPLTGETVEVTKDGMVNRHKLLARELMDYQKEFQEAKGLYTNSTMVDAIEGELAARNQISARDTLLDILADRSYHTGRYVPTQGKTQGERIDSILDHMDVNKEVYTERIARKMGMNLPSKDQITALKEQIEQVADPAMKKQMTKDLAQIAQQRQQVLKEVRNTVIENDAAKAILELNPNFRVPEEVGEVQKWWRNYSSHFKAGVLTWPARYFRDVTGAMVRLSENKMLDGDSVLTAMQVVQGRPVQGLQEIPAIKDWLTKQGRELTDEEGLSALQEMFASYRGSDVFANTDLPHALPGTGKLDPYLDLLPGQKGIMNMKGVKEGSSWNPFELRGTYPIKGEAAKKGLPRQETKFLIYKMGERVGQFTDEWGRMTGFLNGLKNAPKTGKTPAQIMDDVNHILVNYAPSNYTKFDRALKNVVPFWSFMKAQIPYVYKQLTSATNHRLRGTLRAQNELSGDPEQFMPEYISEGAAIPLGTRPDGSERFIGGLGLMHEDPFQFAGGSGVSDFLSEVGSRLHPGIKGPLEYAFDKSLFRKDMMLDELDPTMGRILTNAGLQEPTSSGRAKPFPNKFLEHAAMNSPASRALTTLRTLGDTRKDILGKAANTLTGMRVVDVPPWQREGILRDLASKQVKDLSPRTFSRTYFSKEDIARASEVDPDAAERMQDYNALIALLAEEAKSRKNAKKKNSPGIAAR